jgi:hypothetical protein
VFFGGGDFLGSDLTADGYALFDAAISWAATDPPVGVPGDYNGNGKVDTADYVVWRNGDSPDDSQAGYDLWRANFGNPPGSGAAAGAAVPEPATIVMLLACLGLLAGQRRR